MPMDTCTCQWIHVHAHATAHTHIPPGYQITPTCTPSRLCPQGYSTIKATYYNSTRYADMVPVPDTLDANALDSGDFNLQHVAYTCTYISVRTLTNDSIIFRIVAGNI